MLDLLDLRIVKIIPEEDAAAWRRFLHGPISDVRTIKDSTSGVVAKFSRQERNYVIKVRPVRGFVDRAKLAVCQSRLFRQWNGGHLLLGRDIHAQFPVLVAAGKRRGSLVEVLVSAFETGPTVLELLDSLARAGLDRDGTDVDDDGHVSLARKAADALGAMIAGMTRAGLMNRDLKPSNLVISFGGHDADHAHDAMLRVVQLDTVAIRRCDPRRLDAAPVHMLTCLMLEPIGCGCPPPARLQLRTLRSLIRAWNDDGSGEPMPRDPRVTGMRMLMSSVGRQIATHGDPRPRDNPLPNRVPADGRGGERTDASTGR